MANLQKTAMIETTLRLYQQGWFDRRIALELDVERDTVSRHIR